MATIYVCLTLIMTLGKEIIYIYIYINVAFPFVLP